MVRASELAHKRHQHVRAVHGTARGHRAARWRRRARSPRRAATRARHLRRLGGEEQVRRAREEQPGTAKPGIRPFY